MKTTILKQLLIGSTALIAVSATSMTANAQQVWDTDNGTAGAQGGSGNWDAATVNWLTGGSNVIYDSALNSLFGGTGGTVTVVGAQTIQNLTFNATGYTVQGGALNVGSVVILSTSPGNDATIDSVIEGTGGISKIGSATLNLGGVNTYSDSTSVLAGAVAIDTGGSINNSDVVNISAAGTLTTSSANSLADGATVTSAGTLTIGGADTIDTLIVNGGTTTLSGAVTASTEVQVTAPGMLNVAGTLNTVSYSQTGIAVTGVISPTDLDGANVNANYSAIALGGTVTANGATGIIASGAAGGGNVSVQNSPDGTNANGDIAATVTDHGIFTTAAGIGTTSIYVDSEIVVNGTGHGINVAAVAGDTHINLNSNIDATASSGDGIHIEHTGTGDIRITGTGNVSGNMAVTGSDGIHIISAGGTTLIDLVGDIVGDPGVLWVDAAGGSFTQEGIGDIDGDLAAGVSATSTNGNGVLLVNQDGDITGVTDGVFASTSNSGSGTGTVTVTVQAGHAIDGNGGVGVQTAADLGLTIVNGDGNIIGSDDGVQADSQGGDIDISVGGTVTGEVDGIDANTIAGGTIDIDARGNVTGNGGFGVEADTLDGDILVRATANISGTTTGVDAASTGAGDVEIIGNGNITGGTGDGINAAANTGGILIGGAGNTITGAMGGAGIAANITAGSRNIEIVRSGTVTGGASGGILATNAGTGNVSITGTGPVTSTGGTGISGVTSGGGDVLIETQNTVLGVGSAQGTGINAQTTDAGTITVRTGGDVGSATVAEQSTIAGIATFANGTGNTEIVLGGNVLSQGDGINATTTSSGTIDITGTGDVTGGPDGGDVGIETTALTNKTLIATLGTITGADGIASGSTTGDIEIANMGNVEGTINDGIRATSTAGDIVINRDGTVTGAGDGIEAATAAGGTIDVTARQAVTGDLDGVQADTVDGFIVVTAMAAITGDDDVDGFGTGVNASASGAGNVTVDGDATISGAIGIDADSVNGNVTVSGAGDTTGVDTDAIQANVTGGAGTVLVDRSGTITGLTNGIVAGNAGTGGVTIDVDGNVTGTNNDAINVQTAQGDIDIDTDATVTAGEDGIQANAGMAGNIDIDSNIIIAAVDAIDTTAVDGKTTITVNGATTGGEIGIDANATGSGEILVQGSGDVIGTADDGIQASTEGGDITISGDGTTSSIGDDGIDAVINNGTGNILINRSGMIAGGGDDGINATNDGTGTVTVDTVANVTGTLGDGIEAVSTGGGAVSVSNTAIVQGNLNGVMAASNGAGTVTVATNVVNGTTQDGIDTQAADGDTSITVNGDTTGALIGIDADADGSGSILVQGPGDVTGSNDDGIEASTSTGGVIVTGTGTTTSGSAAQGIDVDVSGGGAGTILISRTGNVTGGSQGGIDAESSSSGSIDVVSGNVTATGANGINAVSTGGGNVGVTNMGTINGLGATINGGIFAGSNNSGTVTVNVHDTIGNLVLEGIHTEAVDGKTEINVDSDVIAQDIGVNADGAGVGEIEVNLSDDILQAVNAAGIGIDVDQTGTGEVDVNVSGGSLLAPSTLVQANGNGPINIDIANTTVTNPTTLNSVETFGTAGVTTIDVDVDLTSTGGDAIQAISTTGDINIVGDGNLATTGIGDAVQTQATTGNTVIFQTGTLTAFGTGDAVQADSTSGTITVNLTENTSGGSANGVGVRAASTAAGGVITINNDAGKTLQAISQNAINMASVAGVANSVNNNGIVLGTITATNGDETINNNTPGGLWAPSDLDGGISVSDLGNGTDVVNNAGILQVFDSANAAPGVATNVTIAGLETFNNNATGIIAMQNGDGNASLTTDRLTIANAAGNTAYVGSAGGQVRIDTFFGGPTSPSDLVTIGTAGGVNNGSTAGSTLLRVNDTNSGNPGLYNPLGAEVVRVESSSKQTDRSHFTLEGGPVNKGFWTYDLFLDDTRSNPGRSTADVFVIASVPGLVAQQTPEIVAGAQNLSQQTDSWTDRQGDLRTNYQLQKETNYGAWIKGFGGVLDRTKSSSFTSLGQTYSFDVSYDQTVFGGVIGADVDISEALSNPDDTLILGIFGGVVGSNQDFVASGTTVDFDGFSYGAYLTYMNKTGAYFDAKFKVDDFEAKWDAPTLAVFSGYEPQTFDGISIGGKFEVGKNFDVGNNVNIDPFIQLSVVETEFSKFSTLGTTVDLGSNTSIRSNIGTRFNTSFERGELNYTLLGSASWVTEFGADNKVQLISGGVLDFENDNKFNAANIGVGLDIDGVGNNTKFFIRGNGEFGNDYSSLSGKIGFSKKF